MPTCWKNGPQCAGGGAGVPGGGGVLWKTRNLCSHGWVKVVAPKWAKTPVFGSVSESMVSRVSLTPRCYFAFLSIHRVILWLALLLCPPCGDEARVFLIRYQVSHGSPFALSTHQDYKTDTPFSYKVPRVRHLVIEKQIRPRVFENPSYVGEFVPPGRS